MNKNKTKMGFVVFALVVAGYLEGICLGEITEYGSPGTAEPVLLQSFISEETLPVPSEGVVVLDFEDLPFVDGRLPSGYRGLEWDCLDDGDPVFWIYRPESVAPTYSEPHSGKNYLVNANGANRLGFSLPNPDNCLAGAWFAKTTVPTPNAVRFNGYNASHVLIQQSPWLTLSPIPQYLAANFSPVARIEVEHSSSGSAWYAMDDLAYQAEEICTPPPQPANPDPCDGAMDVPLDANLSWGEACSADCNLPNGGFESGSFSPWVTVTGTGDQLLPWAVTNKTNTTYFTAGGPYEGAYFAENGFDGSAGLFYDLYQEKTIPECVSSLTLKWSERIQWDMVTYTGSTLPRNYVVSIQPAGGGTPLAILYSMDLAPRTKGDTGYVSHSIDLLSKIPDIAGKTIRINFHEYIPQTLTGPAKFDLDGVSLNCNGRLLLSDVQTIVIQELDEEPAAISEKYPPTIAADLPEVMNYGFDENSTTIEGDTQIPAIITQTDGVLATPGQIVNGDFETGSFSGWTLANSNSSGTFVINNGTYDPLSPDGPLPPYSGSFSALSNQGGPGIRTIYQDVTLPADATTATLRWADRIRNHATEFLDPTQEFRVEIRDTMNNVLSTLFSTNPGDPLISEWTERSAGISQFAGMTIRVAFTEEGTLYYFNVHLDNIRIESGGSPPPPPTPAMVYDVYLGTDPNAMELIYEDINESSCDPTPDPNDTLNGKTTYYWQVIAKNNCSQTEGNIWSFTTANRPPIANAGLNQTVYAWIDGIAEVNLDGSGSYDPDGDELIYSWSWAIDGNDYKATGVKPTIELPVDQHVISLIVNDGTVDSEPNEVNITVVGPVEANLCVTPKVLNYYWPGRNSCFQPRIMAMMRLPKGITKNQIDSNEPLLLYPGEIEADWTWISRDFDCKCRVWNTTILALFDKDELMDAIPNNGQVKLAVVGQLKTGQYFFGTDNIKVIAPGNRPRHKSWCDYRWNRWCRGPFNCRH
jgi:hypothetical protein